MKCTKCSFENNAEAKFCIKCGSPLIAKKEKTPEQILKRKKKTAFVKKYGLYSAIGLVGIYIIYLLITYIIGLPKLGHDMVFVKGGTYNMGCTNNQKDDCSSDEKPAHKVTVGDFYIGKYEVTQRQWEDIMGDNPSFFGDYPDCPVENVSWNDIQEFLEKLNKKTGKKYRLPTEAEWEYAARGGLKSKGYKYSGSDDIDEVAWWDDNSGGITHKVGEKSPNELGIYDMSGNLWEWCNDWYDSDYYGNSPQQNPQGPKSGSHRVYRGGGWNSIAVYCRVANRSYDGPAYSSGGIGFRLVIAP